jgi:hypothetical protein
VIWDYDPRTDGLKRNSEYHEVDVKMSNGTTMTTGVCSKHTAPSKEQLATITEKTHRGWLEEVAYGIGNPLWVKSTGLKLTVEELA